MDTKTLHEQIEAMPGILREALERAAVQQRIVTELETKIEDQRIDDRILGAEDEPYDDTLGETYKRLEHLKIDIDVAESRAELVFREKNAKTTESHVRSYVAVDPEVIRLRRERADIEGGIKQREQNRRQRRLEHYDRTQGPSKAIIKLQDQLGHAYERLHKAQADVEVARATMKMYEMVLLIERWEHSVAD